MHPASRRPSARGAKPLVAVLALSSIVVSLMQTLVVPLIPELPRLLDTEPANASWAVTATLLAAAVVTPISGRLGDMYGKRRALIASLVSLVLGAVLCAMTSSLAPMVIGRVLQGGAAGVIPLGISIMRDQLPAERVGSAIALLSATLGVGGAIGLPLSAAVAQNADWHMLFWLAAGLGALCLVLVLLVLPESPVDAPGRFDFVGAAGLTSGLVCLLLAVTKGGDWGWGSGSTLGLLGAAVVILLVWGRWELRTSRPLVDLRVSARRPVLFTNLASVLVGFAMYAMSLTFPQLLQAPAETGYGLGQSMVAAGLALAPGGITMMLLSPVSARISARRGPRVTLMVGGAVIALGYTLGLVLMSQVWQIVLASVIISAGVGITYSAMPALIMGSVPVTETGAANGLNALMRSVGTSTSSAVMSVVLTQLSVGIGTLTVPTENAFRATFVIAIVAALAGVAVTWLVPRQSTADTSVPVRTEKTSAV